MFFTRSVLASAAVLSFSATTEGSVLHRKSEEHVEVKRVDAAEAQGAWTWKSLFGKRQNLILDCPNDQFASLLDSAPNNDVQGFCNDWLNLDPATVTSEITPTVTVTTSASTTTTQTTVQRTILTSTVVETATVTASASVRRRMVAAAQVEAIATSIVASVIASGTPTSSAAATTKGAARLAAEQGLSTACLCKQVAPTSTVTDDFTVPAVTTTVGVRVLNIIRETETRTYTSTTTVTESATATASGDASSASSTDSVSSRADAEASSSAAADSLASVIAEVSSTAAAESGASSSADAASTDAAAGSGSSPASSVEESSSAPAITTVPIAVTSIAAGNATATASGGAAVVTAIPFSCDEDDINKDIDQVVGGFRLGYSVYCNTGLTSQDRVGRPIPVTDATSCAAQCSLLNSQGAQDACQSAVFTPSNSTDATGGTCELYTAAENSGLTITPAPGSVAIVHTGTYANGDECAALNATTAAVVPTITNGPVVIETPGLVTQSSGGGVSRTYVSANTTDASGFVHFSWYEIYASSANWYAVYETSWACSATITRTIEQEPSTTVVQGSTITSVIVTTIIGNGFTTIISGDSTTTIRGGGGAGGATFVPASTTGGDAGLTTFFSTAVQASTGTDGIVTPTPAPSLGGVGNVTVTEGFTSIFSTGSEGIISPSASPSLNASISGSVSEEVVVSSTATTLTVSGANSTFFSAGSNGILTPTETPIVETIVSSGAVTLTLSGSNTTATSTGGNGVIPPASGSASESSAIASTSSDEWDDENSYGPKTSRVIVVSSSIFTVTSTGSAGIETPILSTAVSSETLIVEIGNTTLSGNGSFTTATSVATFNATGSGGVLTPTVVTEVITTATGVSNFTSIIATATANSTGGTGVIPPASTNATSTGPLFTNTEGDRSGSFSRSSATATANSTSSSGVIPPGGTLIVTEIVNSTLPLPTPTGGFSTSGFGNFSTGGETALTISTGGTGVIPPAPTNSTSTGPPFTNTEVDRSGSFSRSSATATSNFTASSGFATPSSNLTIIIPTPGTNTTLVLTVPSSTGPIPTVPANVTSSFSVSFPEGDRTGSYSTTSTLTLPVNTTTPPPVSQTPGTLVVTATTNITLSLPSSNVTLIPPTTRPFDNTTAPLPTAPATLTFPPLVSINYSTVPSFSTGNLSTILPPPPTGNITLVIPSPTTNVTIIVETPFVPSNSTTAPPASITVPPVSLNSTFSLPVQNSTGPVFTNSGGDRTGRFSRSSGITLTTGTGGFGNITATPPPFPTGNSTLPSGPTAPLTEACPSPTEFSTITREVIITTYTVETVPILASTCISSDAAAALPTGLNGTLPTGGNVTEPTSALPSVVESLADAISSLTATEAAPTSSEVAPVVSAILSAVSSAVSDATVSATSAAASEPTIAPIDRFRRSGTLATPEQISAACNDTGDLILSPTLNIQPNNSNEGWFVSQFNPTIPVESVATDNGTIARFRSAFPGQTAEISQPLTLCPGTVYDLTASTRQADTRSGCTVQFRVGGRSVFTATPQTTFSSRTEQFTADAGTEGASVDLTLVMSCAGFAGAAVGADAEGYMVGEIGSVSVTPAQ